MFPEAHLLPDKLGLIYGLRIIFYSVAMVVRPWTLTSLGKVLLPRAVAFKTHDFVEVGVYPLYKTARVHEISISAKLGHSR